MSALATLPPARSRRILPLARLGDESLAARAAAGDGAAFAELYERYHAPLLGYCRSILLDDDDAGDATQAALENALRALPRKQPDRPLRPWLYRIAHNEAINIVRRRGATTELTELDEPSVPGPEVASEHRVRLAQLVDDLRGLPERQRGALVMRELSGLSYDEIAVALNVSNEAARRAVFDARSALHEAVDGRATDCVNVRHCISDGDRRSLRGRRIRAHLRSCEDCAGFQRSINARAADLHLLGPWLSGGLVVSMLGGAGGGGGALLAGGGAATVTVASWSSMPVLLKGLTVAAVVATTGGAAAEIKHVAKPATPAPRTQAAVHRAVPAASPTAAALAPKAVRAAVRAPAHPRRAAARASSSGGSAHSTSLAGAIVAQRRATATVTAPVVAMAPAATHQQAPAPPAPAIAKPPVRTVTTKLTDLRQQVLDAVQHAQAIAAGGSSGSVQLATTTLQSTLAGLGTTIEKALAQFGLALPQSTVTPAATTTTATTTAAPALPAPVLAPVQQLLDGVDSLLTQLLARHGG